MPDDRTTTETQTRPNIATEHPSEGAPAGPTDTQPAPNISTEHQQPGDARRPDDQLDRGQERAAGDSR